jgi:hypothetical protein
MCSFPVIMRQTQDTFPHSCDTFPCSRIFTHHHVLLCIFAFSRIITFHRASLRSIAHLCASSCSIVHLCILAHHRVSPHIFTFHCASLHFITHLHILTHLHIPSCIFTFHRASSHFTVHLRISLRCHAWYALHTMTYTIRNIEGDD